MGNEATSARVAFAAWSQKACLVGVSGVFLLPDLSALRGALLVLCLATTLGVAVWPCCGDRGCETALLRRLRGCISVDSRSRVDAGYDTHTSSAPE
jgi:hypothetical protein